jgi:hypothetical protein
LDHRKSSHVAKVAAFLFIKKVIRPRASPSESVRRLFRLLPTLSLSATGRAAGRSGVSKSSIVADKTAQAHNTQAQRSLA